MTGSAKYSLSAFGIMRSEMFRSFTMMPSMIQGYVALGRIFDFLHNVRSDGTGIVEYSDLMRCGSSRPNYWMNMIM